MNSREQKLMNMLTEEQQYPDTIFLHKDDDCWIAYQHSALLLRRYFKPIRVRRVRIGGVPLLKAVWNRPVAIITNCLEPLEFSCSGSFDLMKVRGPYRVSEDELFEALYRPGLLIRFERWFMTPDQECQNSDFKILTDLRR